jgi:hypothetical protein
MNEIIDYVKMAQAKKFDKKLAKNILKRCVISPLIERFMKKASTD